MSKHVTPEERHQIVVDYIKEVKKDTKVFHLRWSEGELLTKKVLITTPAFWYMKYGWKRKKIEDMFFKAQIEVDLLLERSFDEVFGGGYKGQRWQDTALRGKLDSLWERIYGTRKWRKKTKKKSKLTWQQKQQQIKLKQQQQQNNPNNIEGADEQLTFDEFLQALKMNKVTITPQLAQNIFNEIDTNKNGFITKLEMDAALAKLDEIDFSGIANLANNPEMLNLFMMKKVMDCLLSEQGLQFVETEFIADLKSNVFFDDPECVAYLNKLGDRDLKWEERVTAMIQMNAGLVSGKFDAIMLNDDQVRQLLFGIATQLLDENEKVQCKAIEVAPNILDECFHKVGNINVVYEHLPAIIDNFFKILDNPKCRINHQNVKFGIDELIDNIINTQHPVAALQLAKIFAGKCDLENVNNAQTRNFGLQCLSKIMFSLESPYLSFEKSQIKAPKVDNSKLPQKGDPYREWLDCATSHQPGPSVRYMNQNAAGQEQKKQYISGAENELILGYGKGQYRADDDEKKNVDNYDPNKKLMDKTSEEIGAEFVDVVSNGLSAAMMDPNRNNKIHAFKTNNILNQLQPQFSRNLEKESKKRYDQWESGDMKAYPKQQPKQLPQMKKIDPKLVTMSTNTKIKMSNFKPSLPDI